MYSDENRCALAKDFFQQELGAASECELDANFISKKRTVGTNIFMVAIFGLLPTVFAMVDCCVCGCLESVGTSWE